MLIITANVVMTKKKKKKGEMLWISKTFRTFMTFQPIIIWNELGK